MSLSAEEIQKSLEASMLSMQLQMENDHKIMNEKIAKLEKLNMQKDEEIKQLKSNMSKPQPKQDEFGNKVIAELNSQIRKKEKEMNEKIEELEKKNSELNKELSSKDENIKQLELDKKNLNNQIFLLQKKIV